MFPPQQSLDCTLLAPATGSCAAASIHIDFLELREFKATSATNAAQAVCLCHSLQQSY